MKNLYILIIIFVSAGVVTPNYAQISTEIRVNIFFHNENPSASSCHQLDEILLSNPAMRISRTIASGRYFGIYQQGAGIDQSVLTEILAQHGFFIRCYHETEVGKTIGLQSWNNYQSCIEDQITNDISNFEDDEKSFNNCQNSQNICNGSSYNITTWGTGFILSSPDGIRNPSYNNYINHSPWVNPWNMGTNDGCLLSGEMNTIWLLMTVTASGNLEWSFDFPADVAATTVFMDWALWRNTPSLCADITANNANSAPLRCNWNMGPDWMFGTNSGFTGMLSDSANLPLHNASQEMNFEMSLPANVGDQFLLLLDNWSGVSFNGSFNFQMSPNSCEVCGILLDMNWRKFEIQKTNKSVLLSWNTSYEENCKSYRVERSSDGIDWNLAGAVEGHGTTSSFNQYHFEDFAPFRGANYYRLIQELYSGAIIISEIKYVSFSSGDMASFKVFPNPAKGSIFQINSYGLKDMSATIQILDIYGKVIYDNEYFLTEHNNTIDIHPDKKLEKGIYIVLMHANTGTLKQKIIVQ